MFMKKDERKQKVTEKEEAMAIFKEIVNDYEYIYISLGPRGLRSIAIQDFPSPEFPKKVDVEMSTLQAAILEAAQAYKEKDSSYHADAEYGANPSKDDILDYFIWLGYEIRIFKFMNKDKLMHFFLKFEDGRTKEFKAAKLTTVFKHAEDFLRKNAEGLQLFADQ
jgi:hypothetical protein